MLGLALWASPGQAMPTYKEVRQAYRSSDVQVLDRQGQLVQRVRLDFGQRRGDWVALEQISPALQMAVLMSEDRRFESHGGVDWLSVGSAAWDGLFAGRSRGASTITMQLAGLMDQDLVGGRGGRSVWQKLDQVVAAQSLEDTWTKPEILEAYLNQVAFRVSSSGWTRWRAPCFKSRPPRWMRASLPSPRCYCAVPMPQP